MLMVTYSNIKICQLQKKYASAWCNTTNDDYFRLDMNIGKCSNWKDLLFTKHTIDKPHL